MCAQQRDALNAVPCFGVYAALGDLDAAVQQFRTITDEEFKTRHLRNADVAAEALVEAIPERGCDADLADVEAAIDRIDNLPVDIEWAASDIARHPPHLVIRGICSGLTRCPDPTHTVGRQNP